MEWKDVGRVSEDVTALTALDLQRAVLLVQRVSPQVHHAGSRGGDPECKAETRDCGDYWGFSRTTGTRQSSTPLLLLLPASVSHQSQILSSDKGKPNSIYGTKMMFLLNFKLAQRTANHLEITSFWGAISHLPRVAVKFSPSCVTAGDGEWRSGDRLNHRIWHFLWFPVMCNNVQINAKLEIRQKCRVNVNNCNALNSDAIHGETLPYECEFVPSGLNTVRIC